MKPTIKVALLGCGRWGQQHLRTWLELGCLEAVCDTHLPTLKSLKKSHPSLEVTPHFRDLLKRPDIQAVVIATPADTHARLTEEALNAGKDVFVEKPLTLNFSEAETLIRTAKRKKRILMVGHVLEYHPAIKEIQRLIHTGKIGKIRYITSDRLNFGSFRASENVLWSFAPHDISLALRLLGGLPDSVSCHGHDYLQKDIADVTHTTLHFPNGVHATIHVSWLYPFKTQRFVIVGDKRMAVFDDLKPWGEKLTLYSYPSGWNPGQTPLAGKIKGTSVRLKERPPLSLECEHFRDCVQKRRTPFTDGTVGLNVLKILETAHISYQKGGIPVMLSPAAPKKGTTSGSFFCHPTATIDSKAVIGAGTKIWHYSHVSDNARIGKNCTLGQNVYVGQNVTVGEGSKIQNNVSLYEGVSLDKHVFCGPSVVFTNVLTPRSEINRKNEFKRTRVGKGATLGANSTILCGVTISPYAFVAAGATVTRDVPAYALVKGTPARKSGWVCICGKKLPKNLQCECGRSYILEKQALRSSPSRGRSRAAEFHR